MDNRKTPTLERWRLPDGIEELLPAEVMEIESLRRNVLDLFHSWGYETVIPPLIEYLESLLTGSGNDLDLQTFKLTDQLTGRMMGVRADMTPQVARIDAHRLNREGPTRLCYLGSVLHTRPEISGATRSPIQVGAELYGHAGIESDLEIIRLMLEMVKLAGHDDIVLDLGHVGIYRGLIEQAGISAADEPLIFDALQRKATTELHEIIERTVEDATLRTQLSALSSLNGGVEVLSQAKQQLPTAFHAEIEQLEKIVAAAESQQWGVDFHIDLAELRGYDYHTGVLFAAYVPQKGDAVASGGRYDNVGEVFGRARPATGFSGDLKNLVTMEQGADYPPAAIFAPSTDSIELDREIDRLRKTGERVVVELAGQKESAAEMGCDRRLVQHESGWTVETI